MVVDGRVGPLAPGLDRGDGVRLKFLYPGGEVEIMDGTWLGVRNVDFSREGDRPAWVVVDMGGRVVWKPLSYLVQLEVTSKGEAGTAPGREPPGPGYHG